MKRKLVLVALAVCSPAFAASKYPKLPNGWHVHDMDRPQPVKVSAGKTDADAPSDAVVLFDGSNLDQWQNAKGGPANWTLGDGFMEVSPKSGSISTKGTFGDVQLHIEWAVPAKIEWQAQKRGNSGVFLMGLYEIQVMDAWDNPAYPDGMAGAVYGQNPALVNAAKKPGEWQTYDIVFTAPIFDGEKLVAPAYVTIFWNGVLVQNHTEIYGPTEHQKAPPYVAHAAKLPVVLQNHGSAVRYRNIWVRDL